MVVLTFLLVLIPVGFVAYWLGRGRKLNQKIKHRPEDVAVNPNTGEVIERGSKDWANAEKMGWIDTKVEFK